MRKRLIISIILLVISVISLAAALIMWNAAHAPVSGYATSQGNISLTVLESAVGENGWSEIIPPEGVFEPYNASLSGTHVSTFSVRFVGLNLSSSNMLRCDIRKANGHILQISRTGVNARYENFSLNYTVQASDSIINDAEVGYIPWILKNCSIVNISGSVLFNETHKGRIYTHDDSYWTDDEVTRAVTCEGTPGVYFDNSASCEFSEDTLFALQMRNGNPVEVSCFNNHGVNCSNDYCKGIYFPTCDPLSYFLGYSADTDDPNGYTTFTASFAGYNTPVAYTRYTNTSGGSFKLRVTQALTSKTFSFTIYNLTYVDAAKTSVYGYNTGAGTLTATQQVDGTWSVAYYRFTAFTGTLDFAFNVSFTGGIGNDNRTLKLVIAYGTDTNQGAPSYFDALFNTTNGLYNSNENQTTALTTDGSVCGDGVNNDFDYISAGGAWTYSYDCFDRDCNGSAGSSSQTNEFGAGKTGYCNYGRELNCTDEFDNDYDYANSSDYTDCHDANCFHIDAACPAVELICNDGINNDWDYTNTESDAANKVGNNGTKYTSGYTSNLIDCEDGDCNNQIGGPLGQICTWGYERNCSDAFDNDELQLKDCELTSVAGATAMPSVANAEYDCSGYCRATNASIETGDACRDNIDNDWDAVIVNGLYTGTANNTWGAGIDCRWTSYNPDEECNLTMMNVSGSMKRCELAREITCNDGFDNDYDTNAPAAMRPSPNWTANAYLYTFNLSLAANSDFEDYDCQGDAEVPASESSNASWCFDGIDNDMDRYYWNGSAGAWEIDNSGGIDCVDSDCLGAIDPDTSRTCLLYEYNSSDSFFMLLANPGMFCSNSLDDDADNGWGWPTGGTDCRDPDCNKQFGMCAGPCYETENVSWNSCANGLDDDYDMPTAYPDCEDSTCLGMVGDSTGATCESAETQCDDGLDNDADSQTDCSDSSCSNRAGGKINDIQVYCRASEATNGDCSDGFDNDADGYADCYDAGCNTPCNLSTISGTSPITLPVWLGVTSINSVTDAYILAYTKQIKNGYEYNITFRKTGASTNAQWTLGTAARQFNKTKFNTASAHLAGANADNFTITETANGFRLDSNHANLPSGYTFSFLVTSITPFASSTYELTYAEEYGAKTSLNNYFYHEVDENVTPTAQSIKISPQNGKIDYGASVYLRANISD
ncbi:MAG: hypothetical protein MUF61_01450, partial [archaeon]|nr:hypothetical protein [archaeon]